jgi:flavin reductase (DIM6/NTAB) family NADH-FMN oxidoreductase RutF
MSVSEHTFRQVMSTFCTGVTIVTFRSNGSLYGLTVSAFASLSLNPALVLVCIDKSGSSHNKMLETDCFAVNILSDKQKDLAWRFADSRLSSTERFTDTELLPDLSLPVFKNNLSYLICRISDRFDGGDHSIFIGEVQQADIDAENNPLIYYRSAFPKIVSEAEPG